MLTRILFIILVCPSFFVFVQKFLCDAQINEQTVTLTISNGKIRGSNNGSFFSFRGIPYAKPPIGDLRFEPPVRPANWTGIKDCVAEPNQCVQTVVPIAGSEDCLYMNVYTPKLPETNTPLLPVMVWIHGGGFILGNSSYKMNAPDYLLAHGVVVAMFNYRVGIFGFFSTGDMVLPGNGGMKDQVLALKWVQENIAFFGGDPKQVTVFGQSAGSVSISYHLQSPLSRGLFRGAIMESGTSLCPLALSRYPKSVMFTIANVLNVKIGTTKGFVDQLKRVDYQTLQTIGLVKTGIFVVSNYLNGLYYAPVVEPEHNGAFFTGKSYEMLKAGNFTKVPVIIGFNSYEGFEWAPFIIRVTISQADLFPSYLAPIDANIYPNQTSLVGRKIRKFYWGNQPSILLANPAIANRFVGDFHFIRPIDQTALLQSQHATVYYYRFSYTGNLNLPGAPHAYETTFLFKNVNGPLTSATDQKLMQIMTKMWTNFAKNLNPTPVSDELFGNVQWPVASRLGDGRLSFIDIVGRLEPGVDPNSKNMTFWRNIYDTYGHRPFDTY